MLLELLRWSGTAWVAAASSDVLYFVSTWSFNALWHERPDRRMGGVGLVRRLLQYGILGTVGLVVFLDDHHDDHDPSNNNNTHHNMNSVWIILWLVLTCLAAVLGWRDTRQHLVQGGPYHEPSSSCASCGSCSPPLPPHEAASGKTQQQHQQQQQVIVVTGANTGIGKETVEQLAGILSNEQTTILLLCRSIEKGQAAIQEIQSNLQQRRKLLSLPQLRVISCDLESYASVRQAATEILAPSSPLDPKKTIHVLINNAGVMLNDLTHTIDGHETMLQANYLGHFLLTALLLPHFCHKNGRIINVSSSTYAMALRDFPYHQLDDLQFHQTNNSNNTAKRPSRSFSLFSQYAATKWCNILHTLALHDKLLLSSSSSSSQKQQPAHGPVMMMIVAAVHPGLVRTDVVRHMPAYLYYPNRLFAFLLARWQKTPPQGAWGSVHAALTPSLPSGQYWVNRKPQALRYVTPTKIVAEGENLSEQAEKLWQWSCRQVNLSEKELRALRPILHLQHHDTNSKAL